jgi:AraC-like DNA-binding protein
MFFESEECTRYENIFRGELRKSFFLGKVAYHEGNYKKAIDVLESGLENKGEFESIENFNEDYLLYLAKSHKKLSNFEKANAYFEDHIKVLDSVVRSKDTISGKLRDEEVKQITKEFNNLETAKEILTRNILYGGTSMAVLFMVILGSVYRSRKRNQKKFQVVLAQLEQKEKLLSAQEQTVEKHKVSYDLKDDVVEQISIGLKKLEKKEYFLQSDCTQVNVAKKLKTNTAYVSKFMNAHYGYNFNTYLNNLRIDYAIDRLKNDTVFRSYTVQAISEELGYKSVNTFTKAFKNETGILPSYYIKKVSSM